MLTKIKSGFSRKVRVMGSNASNLLNSFFFQTVKETHTSTICLNQLLQILLAVGQLIAIMVFGQRPGRIVKIGMDGLVIQRKVKMLDQYLLL